MTIASPIPLTGHFVFAFIVLAYFVVPLVAYLVYWLFKRLRRGPTADGEGETESS